MLVRSRTTEPGGLKLQDVCDGLTREQLRVRERLQGHMVRSARERVLSARSTPGRDGFSSVGHSRLSSYRRDDYDQRSYANEFEDLENVEHTEYNETPDLNSVHSHTLSDSASSFNYAPRALTLPDAEMLRPEHRIMEEFEKPELRSYNSFHGEIPSNSRICMRSKSAMSRELDGLVNGMSRQCCDVLGPKVCHQCALYKRRVLSSQRHERPLSRLHTSEKNFADSIVLSRTLPDLSMDEIEDKVVSGEILRASLKERLFIKRERTAKEKTKPQREFAKERGKTWNGVSTTFFMNIQDLNNRVLVGKLTNKLSAMKNPSKNYWMPVKEAVKETKMMSLTEKLLPAFRTAREEDKPAKPKRVVYFDPPLLPKVCQNVAPSFFAGSDVSYELPDRLPDKVTDDQIDDLSAFDAAWSRSSSALMSEADPEGEKKEG